MVKLNQRIYKRTIEGDYTSYRINNIMNLDSLEDGCPYCKKEYTFFECWAEYFNEKTEISVFPCKHCLPVAMDNIMTSLDDNKVENLNRIHVERI